jgi:hypothetical protein
MALRKPKAKKLPRKPKMSASNQVKENYLIKVKAVKAENAKMSREYESAKKKSASLNKAIAGI